MSRTGRWHLEDCNSLRPFSCYSATVNRNILHLQPMNFYDAQSYCRYKYTDLSTTTNDKDNDEVTGLLRSNTNINVSWIGLERYAWTWSDGSNSPFSFWTNGRPVGQDLCGTISSTTWGSYPCTRTNHFICYQDVPQSALRSVKVRVRGGSADLSDPMVQQSILQQLQQKLKDQGVTGEVKLWWNKQPDGEVFHREEEVRGHCEDGDACVTPVIDL
ncbi:hypothetical protein INR49_006437 [Caranx melampygus]|nr:hypothetical protein INR49_006437 [Caranx melampygus]